jgi:alpha-galactosidase
MIQALVITLALAQAPAASDAKFTGVWSVALPAPDGSQRETLYEFKAEEGRLSGKIYSGFGVQDIVDGKVEGDRITFATVMRMMDQERRMVTEGVLSGDELKLKRLAPAGGFGPPPGMGPGGPPPAGMGPGGPPPGGGPGGAMRMPTEMIARKLGAGEARQKLAALAPPPKLPLPELRELKSNGLARTPPMGWNSWNKFRTRISDALVREIADAMVSSGMRDAGYIYVNIDDGWQGTRDPQGNLRPNDRFPDMKALADYVHGKGLKLGIYSSPGPKTCAQYEGSYGHEEQDAKTFAAWGIDYLKYDWCSARTIYSTADEQRAAYQKMGTALQKAGRPIVYALCQYGQNNVGEWGPKVAGNLWRTTGDIRDSWASMERIGFSQDTWAKFAGPGRWNDPDMLEIGNGGMTDAEYRTHMSLWALLAAPLLAGNDIRSMTEATKAVLLNREVIAVDQDKLGRPATRVSQQGTAEVWARPLAGGAWAVGLFNRGTQPAQVTVRLADLGAKGRLKIRDLWAHADQGPAGEEISRSVEPHGVALLRLSR